MKKTTLAVLAVFWVLTAAGTFWWGRETGRQASDRETAAMQARNQASAESASLLGDAGKTLDEADVANAGTPDGATEATKVRSVGDIMADIFALTQGGMMTQSSMLKSYQLIQELDEVDMPAALEWVEGQTKGQQQQIMRMSLLSRLAQFDGLKAMDYALAASSGNQRMMYVSSVVSSWSEQDPEGVFEWLEENQDTEGVDSVFPEGGRYYLSNVFLGLSRTDLDGAFEKLHTLDNEQDKNFALSGMMFGGSDPKIRNELIEHLEALEDTNLRNHGYQILMSQWASSDPADAATFLEKLPDLDTGTVDLLSQAVGNAWMQSEPEQAANWLVESATEGTRSTRINQVIGNWVYQDPNEAAKWLSKFPPSLEIDDALRSLSMGIVQKDGEAGFEWAARMTDDNKRNESLQLIFRQWYNLDAKQAEQHLRSSAVPPEVAEEWIKHASAPKVESTALGARALIGVGG